MENDVNSKEMLCSSENPRKGFYNRWIGGEQNKNNNIFSNPTPLKLSFALGHGIFYGNSCFLGNPKLHTYMCHIFFFKNRLCFYINL